MCKILAVFLLFVFFVLSSSYGQEYNLRGEAGQAYSIDIYLGRPPQKLNVIVDTGSTTLAIAGYHYWDDNTYFHSEKSETVFDTSKKVQAKYSQGNWVGKMASDLVQFPAMPKIPTVRTDIALIMESHNFFMNGSGWQGLLGLAYLPVGARGEDVIVDSWLNSIDRSFGRPMSFRLDLCGPVSSYNATHVGNFEILDDSPEHLNTKPFIRTPILRQRWYEVGVLSIRVLPLEGDTKNQTRDSNAVLPIDKEMCRNLNQEKSIVDSGTTNIRLPDIVFRQVISELRNAVQTANELILDEFWYHSEAACWQEPQLWNLPWLAIDLLSDVGDDHYFTLEIPPQNYMRLVTAHNSSNERVSEFCYKLGIEAGGKETVLGYTAMEGFEVLFNRDTQWIGWKNSECGPATRVSGPFNISTSIVNLCHLDVLFPEETEISIKAAQWTLCVISIVAFVVLVYLLLPCAKMLLVKKLQGTQQMSLSRAALVEETT